jgi:hypothetical protein
MAHKDSRQPFTRLSAAEGKDMMEGGGQTAPTL